jgi:hypothetical protein
MASLNSKGCAHNKVLMKIAFILISIVVSSHSLAAVVVERLDTKNKIATVKVVEEIQYEEEHILKRELDTLEAEGYKLKLNAIQLNTRGGNKFSAMAMGRLIRERKLNTYVAKDSRCGSACIFVVSGGLVRMVYGYVTVHRPSLGEGMRISSVEKFIKEGDAEMAEYIKEMGLSMLVTDAILMTPHWAIRELTEQELRRWGVNATDRMFEEMWFRNTAIQTKRPLEEVRDMFDKHIDNCSKSPQRFEMTMWDCVYRYIAKGQ